MTLYILKRLVLMLPTLIGVMLITFVVTQFVPGGAVERMMAQLSGYGSGNESAAVGGGLADILCRYGRRCDRAPRSEVGRPRGNPKGPLTGPPGRTGGWRT